MKLAVKIPVVFGLALIVPLLGLGWLAYASGKQITEDQVLTRLEDVAALQEEHLNSLLKQYQARVQRFADSPTLRTALAAQPRTTASLPRLLQDLAAADPAIQSVTVLTDDDVVVASTRAEVRSGSKMADLPSPISTAYARGKQRVNLTTYAKDPQGIADHGREVRGYFSGPIATAAGMLDHVVIVESTVSDLYALFERRLDRDTTGEWMLVDRYDNGQPRLLVPPRSQADPQAALSPLTRSSTLGDVTSLALTGHTIVRSNALDYRGTRVATAIRPIQPVGWGLVYKVEAREAFAGSLQLQAVISLGVLLVASVIALVGFYVAFSLIRPLRRLAVAARQLTKGDFSHRITDVQRTDEVGLLAQAFNAMASRMQRLYRHLEDEVQEKTIKLEDKVQALERTQRATINVLEDLHEEKLHLEEEKKRAEAVLENIGEGVIAIDNQGKVLFMNQAAEGLLGWQSTELSGRSLVETIQMYNERGVALLPEEVPLVQVLDAGRKVSMRVDCRRKNGRRIPVAIIATPITVQGRVLGAIGAFRDITKEQEVERAKSEFVTLASHQLRTPMSAILWLSEMLLSGDHGHLSEEQKDAVQQIYASNQRLASIVDAMLMVSSIELGNVSTRPEPVDIVDLCRRQLGNQLRILVPPKKLQITENYQEVPQLLIDADSARIILYNVLSNAIKYTPEGGAISITIKKTMLRHSHNAQDAVMIEVSDTGYGIPQAEQGNMFVKLFRATNAKERDTDGTGLGLYIVKSLITRLGGTITFHSTENKGSTFTMTLPVAYKQANKRGAAHAR